MSQPLTLALLVALSGCARYVDDQAQPDAEARADARRLDSTRIEGGVPADRGTDLAVADVLPPADASFDVLSPDVLSPDVLSPDVLSPDVLSPDVLSPDVLSPDLPCDEHPGNIGIQDIANQPPGKVVSHTLTITGISCPVLAQVGGVGNPELRVSNTGSWSTSVTVEQGDKLQLRVTTSTNLGASLTVNLSVGTRTTQWTLTTCTAATCMIGSIGSNAGCNSPDQRVWRWRCPGSSAWIYAREFTYQYGGTGLLACPAKATCEWQTCGGNGWSVGSLSCP